MNGTILLEGATAGNRFIGMSAAGAVAIGATGVIRSETGLGGNTQIGVGNNFFSAMALTNGGLISSQGTGRTITINAATLANIGTGKLAASDGGILTIAPAGTWTNGGTIELSAGGIVNLSGTFDATGGIGTFNNTGGTVNVTGTINAGGGANTLTLNSATGSWTLSGGTISGGEVSFTGGTSLLINSNTNNLLTGVTINGDVNLSVSNAVTRIGPRTTFTTAHGKHEHRDRLSSGRDDERHDPPGRRGDWQPVHRDERCRRGDDRSDGRDSQRNRIRRQHADPHRQ